MAKRMQYSVVGLPHYTIWHLYEPSADDLRHMEDMERERLEKEKEEKEKQDRERKIAAEFDTSNELKTEWEADKQAVENSLKSEPKEVEKDESDPDVKVVMEPKEIERLRREKEVEDGIVGNEV
jgi:mannan polymerase II complex ANP1 subunit